MNKRLSPDFAAKRVGTLALLRPDCRTGAGVVLGRGPATTKIDENVMSEYRIMNRAKKWPTNCILFRRLGGGRRGGEGDVLGVVKQRLHYL